MPRSKPKPPPTPQGPSLRVRARALVSALVGGPPPRASALVVALLIAGAGFAANGTDTPVMAFGPALLAALLAPLWLTTPAWLALDLVLALATAGIDPETPLDAAGSFGIILAAALVAGVILAMVAGQVQSIQSLLLRQAHAREELMKSAQEREQQLSAELSYASDHDALTGMRTRQSMLASLDAQIAKRIDTSVLVLALAGFADVNETLGPVIGDHALVEVGRRLSSAARESDLVARLGGDEFAVVMPHLAPVQAQALAAAMQKALVDPVVIEGHTVPLRSRAGLACSANNGLVASELVA
ncbi:MAG: putative signaling protein, partial [Frankiales bacterium]|nr:putative signaling protein [Frankiales bacterium]